MTGMVCNRLRGSGRHRRLSRLLAGSWLVVALSPISAGISLLDAGSARAAGTFYIRGAGDGHGIGMSQYGALGFALHNWSYQAILGHYYENTTLGTTNPDQIVSVLLADGSATFSGASSANGKKIKPGTTYTVRPASGGDLELVAAGKKAGTFSSPLTVKGLGPLDLAGHGLYRGSFVFRPDGANQIQTVNALDLEDYVRGVISWEMPSSWPMAALEAQAIAARTYAITAGAVGSDFDVYDDTRSQMYGGVAAETPRTNAAVAATSAQVVSYDGTPATTYFFSSSGGYTESIQNVWYGVEPEAWLHGVPDPYDDSGGNPYYRWKLNQRLTAAESKLHGLYRGTFVGIKVLKHGVSPRIVSASVVGTKGSTTVTGAQLQQIFNLMSTYVSFTTISSKAKSSTAPAPNTGGSTASGTEATDARSAAVSRGRRESFALTGTVFPARPGVRVAVQELALRGWTTIERVSTGSEGSYALAVPGPGRFRVLYEGMRGPVVTVS